MSAPLRQARRAPLARRSARPWIAQVEPLETRQLLAGAAPTDAEQYMLELINRARANPAAEGQRLLSLAATNPVIHQATQGWNLSLFDQTISSYPSEPPLAFNPRLIDAALAEDQAMLATNNQAHSPSGFLNNVSVATDSDGQVYYNTGSGGWATGENIFAFSGNVTSTAITDVVDYFEAGFLIDWGNSDFGHLKNLLSPGPAEATYTGSSYPFNEVGVGLLTNVTPTVPPAPKPSNPANAGINVGPDLVTQEFGWRQGTAFLTGTFYQDTAKTGFYAPGEGLGNVTIKAVGTAGQGTFSTQTWASGGYSLQLPPGTYNVTASGNIVGNQAKTVTIGLDNASWEVALSASQQADIPVPADYDGLGHAEVATYQPSTQTWFIDNPTTGPRVKQFGAPGDIPVPGRYDGGAAEIAVYRPSTATWFILTPSGMRVTQFGAPGDTPVPGNYDGPGKTDLAVYRASNATWYIRHASDNSMYVKQFGISNLDEPVQAAYDGGGTTEIAVLRPSTYQWFILGPSNVMRINQFGTAGEIPVPGDYDGLGKAELALYQPSTSNWYVWNSGDLINYGLPNLDQPAPANYDGSGRFNFAVFQPGIAQWLDRSVSGVTTTTQFGQGGIAQTLKTLESTTPTLAPPSAWTAQIPSASAQQTSSAGNLPALTNLEGSRPRVTVQVGHSWRRTVVKSSPVFPR